MAASPAAIYGMVVLAIAVYAGTLTDFKFQFFRDAPYGYTFNSMLEHMLRFRFDVDPDAIGGEGFIRDGRVYAYFGPFPALLRLLFLPFVDLRTVDVSVASCFMAAVLSGLAKVGALRTLQRSVPAGPATSVLFAVAFLVALFSGAQLQFLAPTIYVEVVLWDGAFAALFLWGVARGAFGSRGFTPGLLMALASCAGAALLTRVSTGLGLYVATVCLAAYLGLTRFGGSEAPGGGPPIHARRLATMLFQPMTLYPALILAGFALACAIVNYERWGNPLTFTDLHRNIIYLTQFPDRIARLDRYGEFNVRRLWYGIMYYFFPVWVWHDSSGQFLFTTYRTQFLQWIELPPSSFFVSDPLLLLTCGYGLRCLAKKSVGGVDTGPFRALAVGLAVPPALMLIAISMSFRYRIEFYPFLDLGALLGLYAYCARADRDGRAAGGRVNVLILSLAAWSVAAAILLAVMYKVSSVGDAQLVTNGANLVQYYLARIVPGY